MHLRKMVLERLSACSWCSPGMRPNWLRAFWGRRQRINCWNYARLMSDLPLIIAGVEWKNAKTSEAFTPHEYIVRAKYPEAHAALADSIKAYGRREPWQIAGMAKPQYYRYWRFEGYKYWHMGIIINRVPIKENKGPVIDIPE